MDYTRTITILNDDHLVVPLTKLVLSCMVHSGLIREDRTRAPALIIGLCGLPGEETKVCECLSEVVVVFFFSDWVTCGIKMEGVEGLSTRLHPNVSVHLVHAILLHSYPICVALVPRLHGEQLVKVTNRMAEKEKEEHDNDF